MPPKKKASRQRRRRGEGSYYARKDGRWVWEGKILGVKQILYGVSYEDVHAKRDVLLADASSGLPPIAGRDTLGEYMHEWLLSIRRTVRPKTYSSYESTIRVHIAPAIGAVTLRKLTAADISARLLALLDETPRTAAYALVILRHALRDAVRAGRLARNVAEHVAMPRYDKPEIHPYDDAEFDAWLSALEGHHYRALFLLGATMGLRKGEALGLSWSSVTFAPSPSGGETVRLAITQQVQRVNFDERGQRVRGRDSLQVLPVKTKKSRRVVIGGPELAAAFREQRRIQLEWRLRAGEDWGNAHDLVFTTQRGNPLDPRNVLRMHYDVIAKAGTRDDVTFHGLRHQAGTDMVAAGVDLHKVSQILGHSSIKVTADIYVEPRMTDEDVRVIDRNAKRRGGRG